MYLQPGSNLHMSATMMNATVSACVMMCDACMICICLLLLSVIKFVAPCRSFADARMQQLASRASSVLHPQARSQQASASVPGSAESSDERRQWRQKHSLLSSQDEAAVSQAVTLATKQQESALQVSHACSLVTCISCCYLQVLSCCWRT